MRKLILFIFLNLLVLAGCITINKLGIANLAYLYQSRENFTGIEYTAFRLSDFKSRIFYRLNTSGLAFQNLNGSSTPMAKFSIDYEVFNSYKNNMLIDSGSFIQTDSIGLGIGMTFYSDFEVKTIYPGDFILHATITDVNAKRSFSSLVGLHNQSVNSRQNFLLLNDEDDIIFESYVMKDQYFRIKCASPDSTRLYVRCYFRVFPVALPPFLTDAQSKFRYDSDSLFTTELVNGSTPFLKLSKFGFYHFQRDTSVREGLTLFRFYDGFPQINDPDQMLEPLRYLTTKKEFNNLMVHPDSKTAVDSFWLDIYGNADRAKIMIQKYYSRVEEANRYFTSYLEGWKTDRGIIYIIYGPPNIVYRYNNIEKWIYGEEGNFMSINFNFVRVDNPFTDNDYMLEKSGNYKESWYVAVNNWRR
jgi:GWxTD domain-containing protein